MAALLRSYLALCERKPLLTKIATAGTLTTAGDLIAQTLSSQPFDFSRTARLAMWGFAWGGPTMHVWWRFLDKRFGARGFKAAMYKTAADQLVFAPPGLIIFFTYMGLSQGHSFDQIAQKIKQDYWPTMWANWAVWPAVQVINFHFIPPDARVLFVSTIAVAWNAFLSAQGTKAVRQEGNVGATSASSTTTVPPSATPLRNATGMAADRRVHA